MPKKQRSRIKPPQTNSPQKDFAERLKAVVTGLYYMSETDAEVTLFVGNSATAVTAAELRNQTQAAADSPVEQIDFDEFFDRLTVIQDWFGDEEKAAAGKFAELKNLLETNLRETSVFKIGRIQIDIYAAGLDAENKLTGIQTKAVET